jgi:hypothetical protein
MQDVDEGPQRMPKSVPAVTVTVQVNDGPTVRLTYKGGWERGPIVPYTSITVSEQAATRRPGHLYDLLLHAGSLLLLYAAQEQDWPPDLRPAAEQPPGART